MAKTIEEGEVEKERGVRKFMCELSPELQRLISSFLFAGDSIIFRRLISKSLTSTISPGPTIFAYTIQHQPHSQSQSQSPYLVSLQGDDVLKLYNPILPGFHRAQVPKLSDARIRFSNYGWLLMSTDDYDVFFFEPFSKKKIQLPRYPQELGFYDFCFSSPPTSQECFVIGIDSSSNRFTIIKRDEESWTLCSFSATEYFHLCVGVAPILHNGLCYCLGRNYGHLGMFDPNAQNPDWAILSNSNPVSEDDDQDSPCRCFLLEKNKEELLRVSLFREDQQIQLDQYNIQKKTWRPAQGLKNKMLFLGYGSSFLGLSNLRGMRNKIFFPMIHNDVNLFYSLRGKRYLSFHDDYSSENYFDDVNCFSDVKDLYNSSVWIKPVSPSSMSDGSFMW